MRNVLMFFVLAGLASPNFMTAASSSHSSSARTTQAASATEQIERAAALIRQMNATTLASQRMDLLAQAWSNLALVGKAWPNDPNAIVRAALMQADLAGEFGMWQQVIDPLTAAAAVAPKVNSAARVESKLGKAYAMVGDFASAEQHYSAAVHAVTVEHLDRVEAEDILAAAAHVYGEMHDAADAIRLLHQARDLPGQDSVNKAMFQLYATQEAAHFDKGIAVQELARLDALIDEARGTNLSPKDAKLIGGFTHAADQIRDSLH